MQRSRSREPRRARRGNPSQLSRIASLEPWALALWSEFRELVVPRRLRQVLRNLRELLTLLEERLELLEVAERNAETSSSLHSEV